MLLSLEHSDDPHRFHPQNWVDRSSQAEPGYPQAIGQMPAPGTTIIAREGTVKRIVEGYFTLLKVIITLCLAVMVVLVFGNVVLRYGFNMGITASEEISRRECPGPCCKWAGAAD
jgi:hypothetical protein